MQECRIDQQIKEEEIPEVCQLIGHHRRHFKTEGSYKRIILNRQGTLKTDEKLMSLKILMICVIQTVIKSIIVLVARFGAQFIKIIDFNSVYYFTVNILSSFFNIKFL